MRQSLGTQHEKLDRLLALTTELVTAQRRVAELEAIVMNMATKDLAASRCASQRIADLQTVVARLSPAAASTVPQT